MDINSIISGDRRKDEYPTVITDEEFIISFFNGGAKELIPGIEEGADLSVLIDLYEKSDLKRAKYPSSAFIGIGDKKYFSAFCPVFNGFEKTCVFFIAVPDGKAFDECENYLSMKLASMTICQNEIGDVAPAGRQKAYARLYSSYRASMRLSTALGGIDTTEAVFVRDFFDDAFSYYDAVKYRASGSKRHEIQTDCELAVISKSLCVMAIGAYDISQLLSSNGYCSVTVSSDHDTTELEFRFNPRRSLLSFLRRSSDPDEAFYMALKQNADVLYMIRTLADRVKGDISLEYDRDNGNAVIRLSSETIKTLKLRSGDSVLERIAKDVVLLFTESRM